MPKRNPASTRLRAAATTTPMADPITVSDKPFPQDHPDDIGSSCAERDANADFAGPTRDRVRRHAVNPDAREYQSDDPETARDRCGDALRRQAERDGVVQRLRGHDRAGRDSSRPAAAGAGQRCAAHWSCAQQSSCSTRYCCWNGTYTQARARPSMRLLDWMSRATPTTSRVRMGGVGPCGPQVGCDRYLPTASCAGQNCRAAASLTMATGWVPIAVGDREVPSRDDRSPQRREVAGLDHVPVHADKGLCARR